MRTKIYFMLILTALSLSGCESYTPKPIGYFRIELPEKKYVTFESEDYPYSFEYADVAKIQEKKSKDDPYWIDVVYPDFRGRIYCSYKKVDGNFQEISEDSRSFVYKHTVKADNITEQPYVDDERKVYGMLYELQGNTASAVQFVLTDSVNHFFRGALYFNTVPNQDSLAPVVEYVKEDIIHLVETMRFKAVR